jgi:hypothetical protein
MKFKLLKDCIKDLVWYVPHSKPNILVCSGFTERPHKTQIQVLPDIVEEIIPEGIIQFDDWDEKVCEKGPGDFFFMSEKLAKRNSDGIYQVFDDPNIVCIDRNCVVLGTKD